MKKLLIFPALLLFCSCEDVISIEVKEEKQQLVVDAWLTDEAQEQQVKLTLSQAYFDQEKPLPALGAEVYVVRQDSTGFRFNDNDNDGVYTYTPRNRNYLRMNERISLYIKYKEEEYYAISELKRVPAIDSLKYQSVTLPIKPEDGPKSGFRAQFYANDFAGEGDTYLVRWYKNDVLQARSSEYTLSYDGGLSPGNKIDGMLFFQPIRMAINSDSRLFVDRDKVTVELHSLPLDAYYFLYQVQAETNNGGIFATPPANIPSNIFNLNPESAEKAVGLFLVSKVSRYTAVIDKNNARPAD
ncbi:MAG: DUF4249 domain-containing protein [Leadbetterella sp.]|nr:DUF4249 domain-containing protein [Leadbetterella sp.]